MVDLRLRSVTAALICAAASAGASGAPPTVAAPADATAATDEPILVIHVSSEDGRPIADAEAYLIGNDMGIPATATWTAAGADGRIEIGPENRSNRAESDEALSGSMLLVVRSPRFAWHMERLHLPAAGPIEVTMSPGRAVRLSIAAADDAALPDDLEPIIFAPGQGTAAWLSCVQDHETRAEDPSTGFSAARPQRSGDDFLVRVPDDVESFHVLIDHPGSLRCFQHGPVRLDEIADDTVRIELPSAATVNVSIGPTEGAPSEYGACGVSIMHSPEAPDGWMFYVESRSRDGKEFETSFSDLAPNHYGVVAFTGTRETHHVRNRDDYCEAREWPDVAAGETKNLAFELETFDESYWRARLRGDRELTISVTKSDGSPAHGKSYRLEFYLNRFSKRIVIAEGELPEDGSIHARDLPPVSQDAYMQLTVDGNYLGHIALGGDERAHSMEFALAPMPGDVAPDFTLTELETGETFTLASLRGQVVLLEFWASWCGPCQQPMAHNDEIVRRRADSWAGRATIIGASIDDEIETIRQHVNDRGWTHVRQAWSEGAWQSEGAKRFAVKGVPSAFLIDADGVVVWSGHPASIDVEAKIDELLRE